MGPGGEIREEYGVRGMEGDLGEAVTEGEGRSESIGRLPLRNDLWADVARDAKSSRTSCSVDEREGR